MVLHFDPGMFQNRADCRFWELTRRVKPPRNTSGRIAPATKAELNLKGIAEDADKTLGCTRCFPGVL